MKEEKIVYSEITAKRRPPCTVTLLNEPNFELMAKAFRNLYYQTKKPKKE